MGIDLSSVRTRVNATGLFRKVSDVLALADAVANPGALVPAAFIVAPRETADPSRTTGIHRQMINVRLSVAFVMQAQSIALDHSDEVEAIRSVLKSQLSGWTPTGADSPLNYASSSIRSIAKGFVWAELLFDTKYLMTVEP